METRAGQQTFEKGRQTGLLDGLQQGMQQGLQQGMQQGMQQELKTARELLLEALAERFDQLTEAWAQQIQAIDQVIILKHLFKQAWRCQTVEEFEGLLARVGGTSNGALASVG
jgi:flagellar biosynthesis/type III secretory pathway protein FliH